MCRQCYRYCFVKNFVCSSVCHRLLSWCYRIKNEKLKIKGFCWSHFNYRFFFLLTACAKFRTSLQTPDIDINLVKWLSKSVCNQSTSVWPYKKAQFHEVNLNVFETYTSTYPRKTIQNLLQLPICSYITNAFNDLPMGRQNYLSHNWKHSLPYNNQGWFYYVIEDCMKLVNCLLSTWFLRAMMGKVFLLFFIYYIPRCLVVALVSCNGSE